MNEDYLPVAAGGLRWLIPTTNSMPGADTRNKVRTGHGEIYPGLVLDLGDLDVEDIGNALADQTDYEHRWLINPQTGEITDERAGSRLARAIQGKGAFRRFRSELHDEYPDLLPAWYAFRDIRAKRRAVQWLADTSLIEDDAASRFLVGHPDPDVP